MTPSASSRSSRTLPTRKSKAASTTSSSTSSSSSMVASGSKHETPRVESRQESKSPAAPGSGSSGSGRSNNINIIDGRNNGDGNDRGERGGRSNDGSEKRIPSPPNDDNNNNNGSKTGKTSSSSSSSSSSIINVDNDNSDNDGNNGGAMKEAAMQPAFLLKDMTTIDDRPSMHPDVDSSHPRSSPRTHNSQHHPPPNQHHGQHHRSHHHHHPIHRNPRTTPPQHQHHQHQHQQHQLRRSPSPPSGSSVISRRGRSRSPIGLTPMRPSSRQSGHAGSHASHAGAPGSGHPSGRSSSGRTAGPRGIVGGSHINNNNNSVMIDGRASAATVQASGGGKELSEAALAAGEAAAGVVNERRSSAAAAAAAAAAANGAGFGLGGGGGGAGGGAGGDREYHRSESSSSRYHTPHYDRQVGGQSQQSQSQQSQQHGESRDRSYHPTAHQYDRQFGGGGGHHHPPPHPNSSNTNGGYPSRQRSPSPISQRFPSGSMSFEISPQQSMSFVGGDNGSFDWNIGGGGGQGGGQGQGGQGGGQVGQVGQGGQLSNSNHHHGRYHQDGYHGGPPPRGGAGGNGFPSPHRGATGTIGHPQRNADGHHQHHQHQHQHHPAYHQGSGGRRSPSPVAHRGRYDPIDGGDDGGADGRYDRDDPRRGGGDASRDGRYRDGPTSEGGAGDDDGGGHRRYSRSRDYPPAYSSYHGSGSSVAHRDYRTNTNNTNNTDDRTNDRTNDRNGRLSPSPPPQYPPSSASDNHRYHRSHRDDAHRHPSSTSSSSQTSQRRRSRSGSPRNTTGRHHPQALFPEHHVLSGRSEERADRRTSGDANYDHPRRSSSDGGRRGRGSPHRGSSRDSSRNSGSGEVGGGSNENSNDTAGGSAIGIGIGIGGKKKSKANQRNKATHRSSVFRGSPTPGKDNLPQELLLALEEDEEDSTPPTSPADDCNAEYVDDDDRRRGGRGRGRDGRDVSPGESSGRNGVPGSGRRKGNSPNTSPNTMGRSNNNNNNNNNSNIDTSNNTNNTANSSPNHNRGSPTPLRPLTNSRNSSLALHQNPSMTATVDHSQIDACLQDTMMLNVDDYLNSNLSFRKSYDLEQVFSFIKEGPNGQYAQPGGVGGQGGGDMKLGNLSFNLGFSESRSNDEGDHSNSRKNKDLLSSSGGRQQDKLEKGRDKHDFLPTIHTLRSQSMGLTPINSFSGENKHSSSGEGGAMGSIVPLNSIDGMALRAFFSSSPTTVNGKPALAPPVNASDLKVIGGGGGGGSSTMKIGSPPARGQYGPMSGLPMSLATSAPVVHASTPPSYSHQPFTTGGGGGGGPRDHHYGGPLPPPGGGRPRDLPGGASRNYSASTPPHGPSASSYRGVGPPMSGGGGGPAPAVGRGSRINMGFPNKRVKLSTRHSLHPMVDLSKRSADGDFFVLLKKLSSCFGGFRFKLPEMADGAGGGDYPAASTAEDDRAVVSLVGNDSPHPQGHGDARSGNTGNHGYPPSLVLPNEVQITIAKRRISSSLCAFGGSLPRRTVTPVPSFDSASRPGSSTAIRNPDSLDANGPNTANENTAAVLEESPLEKEERCRYEERLSTRYFMKEHCISWDVELHEVIASKMGLGKKGKRGKGNDAATIEGTPKKAKRVGHFKKTKASFTGPPGGSKFCAPVTPSTPPITPGNRPHSSSPGAASTTSTKDGSTREKGAKIKYRCKLCGQPKQNHTCPYQSSLVRSIGTMVYPAVNAFVSNEPGRLAPALSEMNNFTSLLSQDTSMASHQTGGPSSYGHPPPPMHPHHRPHHRGAPYSVLTPDTSHWSPNTPGGLSTMSSIDPNSPGTPTPPPPGGVGRSGNKRIHNQLLMSRTLSNPLSGISGPPPPMPLPPQRPPVPAAPAGAIPSDVLFRDTMELKREQYRTVRSISTSSTASNTDAVGTNAPNGDATRGPNAYRYPPVPTPYSQRKELGDTLFALSREVPKLADSCASILRDARENDLWDQAVAELTTQVLVVLKCEERDYTLEGLRRHLLSLGIAC